MDSWGPLLEHLAQQDPDLRYYELLTLPNYGWLRRNFIDGGMHGGIPDKAVRARTITLYLDVKEFNAGLDLASIDNICVLLVDRHSQVLWRTNGSYTAQKGDLLSNKLAELFAQTTGDHQAGAAD